MNDQYTAFVGGNAVSPFISTCSGMGLSAVVKPRFGSPNHTYLETHQLCGSVTPVALEAAH
jgi:hypothetical protein